MSEADKLIRVFTGNEISVILLKGELEANAIEAMIRDDFKTGLSVGFYGGPPSSVDLFIMESDMEKAKPIVEEFVRNLNRE